MFVIQPIVLNPTKNKLFNTQPTLTWGAITIRSSKAKIDRPLSSEIRRHLVPVSDIFNTMYRRGKTHLGDSTHQDLAKLIGLDKTRRKEDSRKEDPRKENLRLFLDAVDSHINELVPKCGNLTSAYEARTIELPHTTPIHIQRLPKGGGTNSVLYGLTNDTTQPKVVIKVIPGPLNDLWQNWLPDDFDKGINERRQKSHQRHQRPRRLPSTFETTGIPAGFRAGSFLAGDPKIGMHIARPILCRPFSKNGFPWSMMEWFPALQAAPSPDLQPQTAMEIRKRAKVLNLFVDGDAIKPDDFVAVVDKQQRINWMLVDTKGIRQTI